MATIIEGIPRYTEPTPTTGRAPSHAPPDTLYAPGLRLARGLGWFSIGLGLAEFLLPETMADLTGVRHPRLLRAYGLREIACGAGILAGARPAEWMWGRVAGDVLDLAALAAAWLDDDREGRRRACLSALAVAGVTALDVLCAGQLSAAAALEG